MADRWVQVTMGRACFGICIRDGIVVMAAPIAKWAVGRPERPVAAYYRKIGATFRDVP